MIDQTMSSGESPALAVLDMSGTIVTDSGATERAIRIALDRHGVEGEALERAMSETRVSAGLDRTRLFDRLIPEDPARSRAACRSFEEAYDHMIRDGVVVAVPGAEEAVDALRERGTRVCFATGFGRHTQNSILESLGWMGLADLSLCPDDAGRGKPYPDMILTAVMALDLDDVRDVLVVGDTAVDLAAGRRAGTGALVGVLTGEAEAEELWTAGAVAVLASVAELPGLPWPLSG